MKQRKRSGTSGRKQVVFLVGGEIKKISSSLDDVTIYPSAQRWLASRVKKGVEAGTIQNVQEVRKAAAAIIAASAGTEDRLTVHDLGVGWAKIRTKAAAGNCPPHRCIRRSILNREADIAEEFGEYSKLLGAFDD